MKTLAFSRNILYIYSLEDIHALDRRKDYV
jgi:hypothetical protein